MKNILSYIITFCLFAIVILMLYRNKKEINAQIDFAEQKVEAYPVKVEEVRTGTIDSGLEIPGILSASSELMLIAETQGRVRKIFRQEGEWVDKGVIIAQVDDELMQAELLVTSANYEKAQKDLERAETLSKGGAITQQQLEGLQLNEKAAKAKYITSKKRVADAKIKAPISGYINQLFLKEGGMIGPSVPACELVNTRSLRMTIKVDEQDVIKFKKEQDIVIESSNLAGIQLAGKVESVAVKADYALQYAVEIIIPKNPDELLKPGMTAKAIVKFGDDAAGPIIPRKALVGSTKAARVYVLNGDRAQMRNITVSRSDGALIKVLDGIAAGEMLIVSGQFNLQDGMKVKVIE